jgi:PAS domain S-box-containing protein
MKKGTKHSGNKKLEDVVISSFGEGVIMVDPTYSITSINSKAKEMLGYNKKAVLKGKRVFDIFKLQDKTQTPISEENNPMKTAYGTQKKVTISFRHHYFCLQKNGKVFPITLSISPVVSNNKVRKLVIIFYNVSEEKRVSEIKSDFLSLVSHQLRTPLSVSNLNTEILLAGHMGTLNPEQYKHIKEINFYNKKMIDLLNIFLAVSKIEFETLAVNGKPKQIVSIIDTILEEYMPLITQKKIHVQKEYEKNLPNLYVDPALTKTALQNIISNSIKYTPENGEISVILKKTAKHLKVSILDTGWGIPSDEQDQVFNKLYRGRNNKDHDWDGVGVGLYITKSIIEKLEGKISFNSKENVGTSFHVLLPFKIGS